MSDNAMQRLCPDFWNHQEFDALRQRLTNAFAEILTPQANSPCDFKALLKQLAQHQLVGLRFPASQGGHGSGLAAQALFAECLGAVPSGSIGMALTIHLDMVCPLISEHGSPQQVSDVLRPALQGDILLSHAVSEPQAGSDISGLTTTAVKTGQGWRLNGQKAMISLATMADIHFLVAVIPDRPAPFNTVSFLVPGDLEGLTISPPYPTLGNPHCPIADIKLDDVYIDDGWRLGGEGMGMIHQLQQFSQERILSSLRANEVAFQSLNHAEPCADTAKLHAQCHASQAITYKALQRWLSNQPFDSLSSASKLLSSRLVREATAHVVKQKRNQSPSESSSWRQRQMDSRLFSISTGSDEMMLKSLAASEKY